MKLTKPQRDLLEQLRERPRYVADFYPPFKALKAAGLIREEDGRFSTIAHITAAGIAMLSGADAASVEKAP